MNQTAISNKTILAFFLLTFIISWGLWSPFYFYENLNEFWALPGAWGPTLSALLVTAFTEGRVGAKKLLGRLLKWRTAWYYYLFAIGFCVALIILSMGINYIFFGGEMNFSSIPEGMGLEKEDMGKALLFLPLFYLINTLVGGPIAEELGWRGFAQEKLQERMGFLSAGLLIGLVWFLWHLPLILFLPQTTGDLPIYVYGVIMTLMGGLFGWLYSKTKGSVLLAILFHGGMNFENGILGPVLKNEPRVQAIYIGLLLFIILVLYRTDKRKFANR